MKKLISILFLVATLLLPSSVKAAPVEARGHPITASSLPLPTGASTSALQLPDGHNVTIDNASIPITAASLPLPSGAATSANQQTDALTDTELRAVAVPISAASLPLPSGAATSAAQLPDGHNVTVDNASIAITAASLPLPAGAATETTLSNIQTAIELVRDAIFADDAPFTLTTSKTMVAGMIRDDHVGTLAAAEGDVIPLRGDAQGYLHVKAHVFDPGTIDSFGHLVSTEAINQIDLQFFRDTPANLTTVSTAGGGATSQNNGGGKWETSSAGTASAKSVTSQNTS